jgi:hypothetical protein
MTTGEQGEGDPGSPPLYRGVVDTDGRGPLVHPESILTIPTFRGNVLPAAAGTSTEGSTTP